MYRTKKSCNTKTANITKPLQLYSAGKLKVIKEKATSRVFANSDIPSNTNNPAARPRPVVSSKNKCAVAEKKKLIHTLKNRTDMN